MREETSITASNAYGAWALARWLAGYPLDTLNPENMPGHWREMAGIMFATNGANRKAALEQYLAHRPALDESVIWGHITAADPAHDYQEEEEEQIYHVNPDVPALPADCFPTDKQDLAAGQVAGWLSDFTQWANTRADRSPADFNEAAGVWAAGLAIARRLVLHLGHGDIYPNLYLLIVAPTTLYAKSAAMECAAEVIDRAVPYLLLPRDMSPEAMIDELAGQEPLGFSDVGPRAREIWESARKFAGQRGQLMDEASSLFSGFSRDYSRGLSEFYLLMYDCGRSSARRTKQGGLVVIERPCLSFYGGTTPTLFKDVAGRDARHWGSGLWARYSFLTPTQSPRWTIPRDEQLDPPPIVIAELKRLAEHFLPVPDVGSHPDDMSVVVEREAFTAYQNYDRAMAFDILTGRDRPDERLFGMYGRQSSKALKVALTLAAVDWDGTGVVTITAGHWFRAQAIVEKWRSSTHRLLAWLSRDTGDDEAQRITSLVNGSPEGISRRDIARRIGKSNEETETMLARLVNDGVIEPHAKAGGVGRATVKYFQVLGT